jgi:hypothetical protein
MLRVVVQADSIFLFVNNRPVRQSALEKVVVKTWRSARAAADGTDDASAPFCVAFIDMPRELVDVNVSPDKREVIMSDASILSLSTVICAAVTTAAKEQPAGAAAAPRGPDLALPPLPPMAPPPPSKPNDMVPAAHAQAHAPASASLPPAEPALPAQPAVAAVAAAAAPGPSVAPADAALGPSDSQVAAFRQAALEASQLDMSGSAATPGSDSSVGAPAKRAAKRGEPKRPRAKPHEEASAAAAAAARDGPEAKRPVSPRGAKRAALAPPTSSAVCWRLLDLQGAFAAGVGEWTARPRPPATLCGAAAADPITAQDWRVLGATAGEPWGLCHRVCRRNCGSECLGELLLGCPQRVAEQGFYQDLCRNMALPAQPLDHPVLLDASSAAVSAAQRELMCAVFADGPSPDVLTALFRQLFLRNGFRLRVVEGGDGLAAVEITHVAQGTNIADIVEICDFALLFRAVGDSERAGFGAQSFRPKGVRKMFVKESARLAGAAAASHVDETLRRTAEVLEAGLLECPHGRPAFARVRRPDDEGGAEDMPSEGA